MISFFLDRKRNDVSIVERTNKKNLFKYLGIDTPTDTLDGLVIKPDESEPSDSPENLSKDVFILPLSPDISEKESNLNLDTDPQSQNQSINHYHLGEDK